MVEHRESHSLPTRNSWLLATQMPILIDQTHVVNAESEEWTECSDNTMDGQISHRTMDLPKGGALLSLAELSWAELMVKLSQDGKRLVTAKYSSTDSTIVKLQRYHPIIVPLPQATAVCLPHPGPKYWQDQESDSEDPFPFLEHWHVHAQDFTPIYPPPRLVHLGSSKPQEGSSHKRESLF